MARLTLQKAVLYLPLEPLVAQCAPQLPQKAPEPRESVLSELTPLTVLMPMRWCRTWRLGALRRLVLRGAVCRLRPLHGWAVAAAVSRCRQGEPRRLLSWRLR